MLALFSYYPIDPDAIAQYLETKFIHDPDFYAIHRPGVDSTDVAEEKLTAALEKDGVVVTNVNSIGLVYEIEIMTDSNGHTEEYVLDYWNRQVRRIKYCLFDEPGF